MIEKFWHLNIEFDLDIDKRPWRSVHVWRIFTVWHLNMEHTLYVLLSS